MDPLFWILAGVVSVCVIGIVVLWLLERRATLEQAEESAKLKAIDPREALEEIDTHPIPATASRRTSRPAPEAPSPYMQAPQSPSAPSAAPAERAGEQLANGRRPARPQPAPLPEMEIAQPGIGPLELPPAASAAPQGHLQTTPERATLRAAELARERQSLEQLLEDNQARLDTLAGSAGPSGVEAAASISLLENEMARQREHLQEIIFLEQNYRQIAATVTEQLTQQRRTAPPDTPRAFGVRRHSLARIEPEGQGRPVPDPQNTTES